MAHSGGSKLATDREKELINKEREAYRTAHPEEFKEDQEDVEFHERKSGSIEATNPFLPLNATPEERIAKAKDSGSVEFRGLDPALEPDIVYDTHPQDTSTAPIILDEEAMHYTEEEKALLGGCACGGTCSCGQFDTSESDYDVSVDMTDFMPNDTEEQKVYMECESHGLMTEDYALSVVNMDDDVILENACLMCLGEYISSVLVTNGTVKLLTPSHHLSGD